MTAISRTAPETYLAILLGKAKIRYETTLVEFNAIAKPEAKDHLELYIEACNVILISASLVEASANMFLSLKTDASLFEALEKVKLEKKWTELPRLFYEGWSIPSGGELSNNLKALVRARNYVTHAKPEVSIGGELEHKGNHPKRENFQPRMVKKYCHVPISLMEMLAAQDSQFKMEPIDFKRWILAEST